ncbi:S1 family peptidase [Hirschia baltica]|uniref:Trypsin-like peptidase domain-containing protein n=1 Tax=Hirschia baltica (strain ATCC 49814 / DSM 5838 / IFAM 1418) TaxID=582402 RepID=C6XIB4_HIRBI|nr:serine protease [Hirschia baltica]ACT58940.1 hypothetical protein Hbal_1248 [Hirschia baltica ATCC 49814]
MVDDVLRYGNVENADVERATSNFNGSYLQGISFCTTPIELISNDGNEEVISTATGFFWRHGNRTFLITNWHVLSGMNAITEQLNRKAFIPAQLRFYGLELNFKGKTVALRRRQWILEFDEGMQTILGTPVKENGTAIDVWGVHISNGLVVTRDNDRKGFVGADKFSGHLNENDFEKLISNVGDDCFVLGYPLNNSDGARVPVWKRGTIASETSFGVDGRPVFLIDAAVTEGMSGSPVFRRETGPLFRNEKTGNLEKSVYFEFIGIYAGRLQSKKLEATNLGYVWYGNLIPSVIDHYDSFGFS